MGKWLSWLQDASSSKRPDNWLISSGRLTSLLWLTSRTCKGSLQRLAGKTLNWFRLSWQRIIKLKVSEAETKHDHKKKQFYLMSKYVRHCKNTTVSGIDLITLWYRLSFSNEVKCVISTGSSVNLFLDRSGPNKQIHHKMRCWQSEDYKGTCLIDWFHPH